jgi:HPt (histidine-containing phosphotransfer) domain-containing protein
MPHSATIIDLEAVLERLNGNREILTVITEFFLEDAPQILDQLHRALRSHSIADVCCYAHSLRGLASTFAPNPVVELAAEIETRAKCGDVSHLPELIDQLDSEFPKLIDALTSLSKIIA